MFEFHRDFIISQLETLDKIVWSQNSYNKINTVIRTNERIGVECMNATYILISSMILENDFIIIMERINQQYPYAKYGFSFQSVLWGYE